jgi:transcriptional regulator with XRE-family HTH domain
MDMRVDADRIRRERTSRAWSQEHLASVTDLGLRTIQRIETAGAASNESVSAIASAFEMPISALLVHRAAATRGNWQAFIAAKRLWILLLVAFFVQLFSPPVLSVAQAGLWAWAGIEAILLVARRRASIQPHG